MFCQNCGAEVQEDNKFCPQCGAAMGEAQAAPLQTVQQGYPVNYPMYNNPYGGFANVNQRNAMRQAELDEVGKMIVYFSQKQTVYDEYDEVCAKLESRFYRKRVGLLVWGIIFCVVAFIFFANGAGEFYTYRHVEYAYFILGLIVLFGGGAFILGYVLSSNARAKNYAEYSARFDELSDELYRHYLGYGACSVGAEYTNPSNLKVIYSTIQSGRANTITDALNVLVEDAHRNNMEAYARQTAISSAAAARGARTAAIFSAANFFLR